MKPILRIAAGDLVSKALLVAINLYLIRFLAVDQYSHFTVLLNAVFLGYQLACGPLERLYIAEHERYKSHLTSLRLILSGGSALACILWLWQTIRWTDVMLIFVGVFILSSYQVLRIRLQQSLEFTLFSLAEIMKNILWLGLLILFLLTSRLPPGVLSLLSLLLGTLIAMFLLKVVAGPRLPTLGRQGGKAEISHALWNTRYVIAYSLIGSLVPYLPVMIATTVGSDEITATYGAVMRYLAILGMAVFAFNTVLLPQMAALGRDPKEGKLLMKRLKSSAPWVLSLFVAAVLVIWVAIPYVDQGKYPLLRPAFLILSITPALSLIGAPFINMLLLVGRASAVLACFSAGLVVNIVGYLLLSSSQNSLAPAWSSLLAYVTITVTIVLYATKCRR